MKNVLKYSAGLGMAFLGLTLLPLVHAQEPAPAAQAPTVQAPAGAVIKKETKLVLVDAVVMDKKGHYVRDLEQKDF